MNRLFQKNILTFAAGSALMIVFSCSRTPIVDSGSGSTTTNGLVAHVYYAKGKPAAGVSVRLRSFEYLSDTINALEKPFDSRVDEYTDDSGIVRFKSVDSGSYVIEANDNAGFSCALKVALPGDGKTMDLGADTLAADGAAEGAVDITPAPSVRWFVQIYGLERVTVVNPKTGEFGFMGLPAGKFRFHIISASTAVSPQSIDSVAVVSGQTVIVPAYSQWTYTSVVTLNTASSGAAISGNVYHFPVLMRLSAATFNFAQARGDGGDLRFSKSNGEPLAFEIERWDSANGAAEIWVSVDTIFGNNGTQSIAMLWGNPNAASASSSAAVFDTSKGFQGVWHMNDPGTAPAKDATVNHFDGTKVAMTASYVTSGAIGGAQQFDGVSSYFYIPHSDSGKLNYPESGPYSLSAWVYADTLIPQVIIEKGDTVPSDYCLRVGESNQFQFYQQIDAQLAWDRRYAPAATGVWEFLTGVRNGTKEYLYLNGVCVDSVGSMVASGRHSTPTGGVAVGRNYMRALNYFRGIMDEVRIENVALNPDWVKLCYMNQGSLDRLVVRQPAIKQ